MGEFLRLIVPVKMIRIWTGGFREKIWGFGYIQKTTSSQKLVVSMGEFGSIKRSYGFGIHITAWRVPSALVITPETFPSLSTA